MGIRNANLVCAAVHPTNYNPPRVIDPDAEKTRKSDHKNISIFT
jgi:hypothetical protein